MALMTESVLVWGRGREIQDILRPILDREKRSAVLLYGDSGIGKTTVLREVKTRLIIPGVVIGYHETSQADSDPLLRTLDDLLKQIYSREGSSKQILIACEKAKSLVSVSALKDFLLATMKAFGDSGGLGAFAKGVTSFVGWASDKISSLDAAVPAAFVPKLGVEAFAEILNLLRTALPNEQLVFLIDNLSAPAEGVTAEIRGFGTFDTIQAFLSQRYSRTEGVHFVFSWKLSGRTNTVFHTLSSTFREYKAVLQPLRPISETEELSSWLRHEFAWFRELNPVQQRQIVGLTGGLPEIVVQWRESALNTYDQSELIRIAEDTRNGRFQSWRDALETAPVDEMAVIYGLSMADHSMPVSALAPMIQSAPQNCLDVLRSWEHRKLLLAQKRAGDLLPAYEFDHEHKLAIAREVLPARFADGGEELQRRAHDFFLAHFSLARLGPPTSQNPCSSLYLLDVIQLLSRSAFLNEEAELLPMLEIALVMALIGEKPKGSAISDWGFLKRWPHPFRGWFLDLYLATTHEWSESLSRAVEDWLAEAPRAESLPLAFAEGTACANLVGRIRGQNGSDLRNLLLERLSSLQNQFPKSILIAREAGNAIVNATAILSDAPDLNQIERLLAASSDMQHRFSADVEVAHKRMVAITNAVQSYGPGIETTKRIEELLSELHILAETFSGEPKVFEALALGLSRASYKVADDDERLASTVDELRGIRSQFPNNAEIASSLGNALVNSVSRHGGDEQQVNRLLAELRDTLKVVPDHKAGNLFAIGLNNAITVHFETGNVSAAKCLLAELRALGARLPNSFAIDEITADCIAGAIAGYAVSEELQEIANLVEWLRLLVAKFPQSPMDSHLAKGIANAIGVYCRVKPEQGPQGEQLVEELLSMADRRPADKDLAFQATRGLASSLTGTANAEEVTTVMAEILHLHGRFPGDSELTAMVVLACINAAAMLGHFNQRERLGEFIEITRTLSASFPNNSWMLARHAEILAVAIAAHVVEGDREVIDDLLVEVEDVKRRSCEHVVHFQCARAFAKACMAYGNRREITGLECVLEGLRALLHGHPESRDMAGQLAWGLFNALIANLSIGDTAQADRAQQEMEELTTKFPNLYMGDPPVPFAVRFSGAGQT
jgi:AAA ATPase domain